MKHMIREEFDEYLIISGITGLSEKDTDKLPPHLLAKNSEVIDISKKIIRDYGLHPSLIGIRENHPGRHRFLPVDYLKRPTEVMILGDDVTESDLKRVADDFIGAQQKKSRVKIVVSNYLSEPALLISKQPWYDRVKDRFGRAYRA